MVFANQAAEFFEDGIQKLLVQYENPLILVDIVLKNGFRYKLSYKTSNVTCTLYYNIEKNSDCKKN